MVRYKCLILIVILNLSLISCVEKQTKEGCEKGKRNIEQLVIGIVLNKKPYKKYNYILKGLDIKTGKDTIYKYEGRWFDQLGDYWDVGDTIIKRKGELFLEIHKKETVHISKWTCEGVFVDGISVKELARRKKYGK